MGRGQGIPIEIRRKIAKYFEEHGYDEESKLAAREMYEELSKSDRFIDRKKSDRFIDLANDVEFLELVQYKR